MMNACVAVVCIMTLDANAAEREDGAKAVRNFLTTWLIDQDVELALKHVSKRRLICTPAVDSAETQLKPRADALATLKTGMEVVNRKLGRRARLTDAISQLPEHLRRRMGVLDQPQPGEFTVIDGSSVHARGAFCGADLRATKVSTVMASFVFKVPDDEADGMYFVFQREGRKWFIVSFDRLKQ